MPWTWSDQRSLPDGTLNWGCRTEPQLADIFGGVLRLLSFLTGFVVAFV